MGWHYSNGNPIVADGAHWKEVEGSIPSPFHLSFLRVSQGLFLKAETVGQKVNLSMVSEFLAFITVRKHTSVYSLWSCYYRDEQTGAIGNAWHRMKRVSYIHYWTFLYFTLISRKQSFLNASGMQTYLVIGYLECLYSLLSPLSHLPFILINV